MIITESEWGHAAGVDVETQNQPQPGPSTPTVNVEPPSYSDAVGNSSRSRRPSGRGGNRSDRRDASTSRRRSAVPSSSRLSPNPRENTSATLRELRNTAAQGAINYTFVQSSYNSMLLAYEPASLPLYHISVHMNCFVPSSYITKIHEGDSETGTLIGQFEMGISVKKSTVTFEGKEKLTDAVLSKSRNRSDRMWEWRWSNDESLHLSWTYDSPVKHCYRRTTKGGERVIVASHTPPPLTPRVDGRPSSPATLKVYPDGQSLIEQILISALIIERKRLTPSPALTLMSWSV
ncbi:hypothetical protein K474DRAFT_1706324 [Panus rudis PR-1116 ss-1]|nr:hypothetical protein K474DRAFT_1706324 [Panus rudis PR-1116 ss-1]